MGLGPQDPGPWDLGPGIPHQSLKVRPPGPPKKFKSGVPGPPKKFKSGTSHLFLMNSFFSEYFFAFFYLFIFVSFLDKIQKHINCK